MKNFLIIGASVSTALILFATFIFGNAGDKLWRVKRVMDSGYISNMLDYKWCTTESEEAPFILENESLGFLAEKPLIFAKINKGLKFFSLHFPTTGTRKCYSNFGNIHLENPGSIQCTSRKLFILEKMKLRKEYIDEEHRSIIMFVQDSDKTHPKRDFSRVSSSGDHLPKLEILTKFEYLYNQIYFLLLWGFPLSLIAFPIIRCLENRLKSKFGR